MKILHYSNLILAFLLELAMLAAYCYAGFHLQINILLRIIIGVGVPVVIIIIWNHFLAPKAKHRLTLLWLIVSKVIIFSGAVLALISVGENQPAIALGLVTFLNLVLTVILHQN